MTAILVSILIIIPALGIGDVNAIYNWLLRYLWVFLAFILLKKASDKFKADYKFLKNDKLALGVGVWCFAFTAIACILGVVPKGVETFTGGWWFQLSLNVLTPFILIGLGFILPKIARREKAKA